jgi:hypothetical protein
MRSCSGVTWTTVRPVRGPSNRDAPISRCSRDAGPSPPGTDVAEGGCVQPHDRRFR